MKHFYYYVPPCPRCRSKRTGRYVRAPFTGSGYVKEQSLKMGEIIRFAPRVPTDNVFCLSCGHEWPAKVQLKFWTDEQIRKDQIARGTEHGFEEYQAIQSARYEGTPVDRLAAALRKNKNGRPAQETESYTSPVMQENDNVEIVDMRPKDRIEILYADDALIRFVMEEST